ncbi:hypothetical protein [Thermomonospora umbrina]|uniref:FG-GAP repeat protein n=1 Tax=Thermomonospora umbrina TaxID=111806 RepID=A0A3D9SSQ4_9ACTN|nr:hypothetical protein [Thermomonospora umbrina]REE99006.1 hypothetical protein DFJ69_4507 [Thermomonospora umbrina]
MAASLVTVTVGAMVTAVGVSPAEAAWARAWKASPHGWTATDSPRVSVDRQGDALLTWTACDSKASGCYHQVQARVKPATKGAGPIRTLSPLGASASWPEADSADNGDSAVVWEQDGHVAGRRVSASGQVIGPLRRLSTSAPAVGPVVAVAPGGMALAVWSEIRGGSWHAVARRLSRTGAAGPVLTLGSGSAEKPAVGVDRQGRFVVAWVRGREVVTRRILPGSVSPTRVLTAPIAAHGGFGMVRVGVDRDGDAVISYRSGGGARPAVWASRWGRTGAPARPLLISSGRDNVGFHHAVATDLEGDSMLVWTRWNGSRRLEMLGRRLTRTGARGPVTALGLHDRPDLVLDDDGDGMLVFHSPSAPYKENRVGTRLISRSGAFGRITTLTSDGRVPQVDTRPNSRFTVVWQRTSYPYSIHATTGP